jgi:hypothetical protein
MGIGRAVGVGGRGLGGGGDKGVIEKIRIVRIDGKARKRAELKEALSREVIDRN